MIAAFLVLLALWCESACAVHPLNVSGSNFVDPITHARFEIVGVDYQPGGSSGYRPDQNVDPLSNGTACLRDAILMQALGLNCIRVYNLDPKINHDDCATIFNAAGIYMILDVNSPLPNESLNAGDPWSSYNSVYLMRAFGIVEAFKNYPNTLGFFSANEVINDAASARIDPPYARAVTRDIKEYIAKHSTRYIPVGYSAADVRDILVDTWQYFQCAIKGDISDPSRIDFFGLNSYSWCGSDATFQTSGYDVLTRDFSNTTVPVFFSEYGCNKVPVGQVRPFAEIPALYGTPMRSVFSGGLVYEWTEGVNDFGLVQINDNGSVSLLGDFNTLQKQLNKVDQRAISSSNATATSQQPPTCSSGLIASGSFNNDFALPDTPTDAQQAIQSGASGFVTGTIGHVSATAMPVTVYGNDSRPIPGLKLNVLPDDATNTPTGGTTGGEGRPSTATTTTIPSSSSSKALAGATAAPLHVAAGAGAAAMGLLNAFVL